MDICTIIAKNYVAQARVLARTFAEHHPQGRCSVLVIDEYDGYMDPRAEPFTILTPAQIGCQEFEEMAWRYDVLELSTAVKPWLLAHLLGDGAPAITYLDPDIRVHSSLSALEELALSHGVVLTPHNTVPLPDDGKRPNQMDILLAGVYNLGFVSLGASSEIDRLLRWWRERLLTDCRVDPLRGYFVDQRWFDLAPGLVSDHAVVREPQYNVAYWNLHSRGLEFDGHSYTVDGRPLAFFHFSGFDPRTPELLSRHQSRISARENAALQRICEEYADEVIAAGYHEAAAWPYTYHLLPSGVKFSRRLRKLYEVASDSGEVKGSPFTKAGDASFMSWLAQPAPGAPLGVNRLLAEVYGTRPDLQEAFPDVAGEDHGAFLRWARETGVVEEPVLTLLSERDQPRREPTSTAPDPGARPAQASTEAAPAPADGRRSERLELASPWGVNVVGYFRSELGTGEAARQVVSALDAGEVPLLPVHGETIPPNRQGHAFTHLDHTDARYPVNLICMNADVLGEFVRQAGPEFFDARYSIGMWFWEVERFPGMWVSSLDHLDELWLPTEHVVRAISPVCSIPVTKITLPVQLPPIRPLSRSELNLPDGFIFLFSFDHHSVFERKNPLAVLEAYTRAFDPADGAVLVLKSINAESAPDEHARLLAAARGRPDVQIIDGYLSPDEKNHMVAACDCYVSLHRAEGFGLTMAEAMYLGKPVVATSYSGNLDFMSESNSFLVDHELVKIGPGAAPYPSEALWAQPDVEHAARLLREVFGNREAALEKGRLAAEDIRRTHSPAAAGEIMAERLDVIRESRADLLRRPARSVSFAARLGERVQSGPPSRSPSRLGWAGKLARRIVLRTMRPFTAHQKSLDEDVASSIQSLELKLHNLDMLTAERHALMLAERRNDDSLRAVWDRVTGLTRSTLALESATAELRRAVAELPEVPQRLEELTRSLRRLEWESRAIPYMEGSPFVYTEHPVAGLVQGYQLGAETAEPDAYRSFEDTFRGSEELIRDRQRVFLKLLGDRAPVLDFGCGRGEFLDLLAERGITHLGVDCDAGMVRRCHEKGHTQVKLGDGLEYLSSLESASIGAVFCAQVIEHLAYADLLELFRLAHEKLSVDGIFVVETVNPHSPAALKTFWVDPTHQHPIFPEVTLALSRSSGFTEAFVFHPNGTGNLERDRFTQGEYAMVAARKPSSSSDVDNIFARSAELTPAGIGDSGHAAVEIEPNGYGEVLPRHVQSVFAEFLGRAALPHDLAIWTRVGSMRALIDGVLASDEYRSRRAELEATEINPPLVNCWKPGLERFCHAVGTRSPDGVAIVGSDGHLFLYGGSNDNLAMYRGEVAMAPDWLEQWGALVGERLEHSEAAERKLCFLVVPDKLAVYADLFPEPLDSDGPRPVLRLLDEFKHSAPLLYPCELLRDARADGDTYMVTDSHLTVSGNRLIAEETISALGSSTLLLSGVSREQEAQMASGDLGQHFSPPIVEVTQRLLAPSESRMIFDNWPEVSRVGGHIGMLRIFRREDAPDERTVVVFGDSYSFGGSDKPEYCGLSWFLAQAFREVHFAWIPFGWDPDYLDRVGADLVVCQSAERFIARVPRPRVDVRLLARAGGGEQALGLDSIFNDVVAG